MRNMKLIHPIYLDVPMLVSFAAAIQGGLSFGSDVTQESGKNAARDAKISSNVGFSKLVSSLFDASIKAGASTSQTDDERRTVRESRSHTEASIAITLYDYFQQEKGYLQTPTSSDEFARIEPGALVEMFGVVHKNAVDSAIDYMDAVDILSKLDTSQPNQQGKSRNQKSPLRQMRDALDEDRKRTPISNVSFVCSQPNDVQAVLTLRTQNLRDLTLSELHKNSVRVVGKITRIIREGESMSAFENYGLSLMNPEVLRELFEEMIKSEDIAAEFTDVEIKGPAVQVLPLMIFV